ncbi:MAG: response regulator [Desulfobacteraceae bacterium]|nr:response regulator [Desulfobacteraceae bacterium]
MSAPLRVLLVEDYQTDAELIIRQLKRGGMDLDYERVDTPAQLKEAIERQDWDIIISDHNMPQFDAPSALRLVQASGRDIPFIVVSGTIGEEKAVAMMKAGAHDYIVKDNLTRLLPAVQRELREVELRRERRGMEKRLSLLNTCLVNLGSDSVENIKRLVQLCGEELGAAGAVFLRPDEDGRFRSDAWNIPVDHAPEACWKNCWQRIIFSPARVGVIHCTPECASSGAEKCTPSGTMLFYVGLDVTSKGETAGVLLLGYPEEPELRSQDREFLGILASAIGVEEERRKAVKELHDREEDLLRITENIQDLVGEIDESGILWYASPSFENALGYRREDLLGKPVFGLVHPDDRDRIYRDFLRGGRELNTIRVEFRCRHAEGHYLWMDASGSFLRDASGKFLGAVIGGRDVTDKRLAELALQESEAKYRSLVENSTDMIMRFDRFNRHLFASPSVFGIFPPGRGGCIGRSHRELEFPEEECAFWEDSIQTVFATETPFEMEIRLERESGHVDLNVRFFPEAGEEGGITSVLCVARDITKEKSTEAQLLQAQKMEAIGTLAGGVAHDFNNLLHTIMGYTDILLLGKKDSDPGFKELMEISRAAGTAGELTRQLLAFGRKVESKLQSTDLNTIITHLCKVLARTFPKMIRIDACLKEEGLMRVRADSSQIQQVLLNLAVNARDAMPNGGTLSISTENVTLGSEDLMRYPGVTPGKYVRLIVSDTGDGMDKRTMEKIFDPFFTTKDVGKGTGLGLAMVYGILKNHHGHIFCSSEQGRGTTFTIFLPVSTTFRGVEEPAAPRMLLAGTESVLLVDDEELIRDVTTKFLQDHGYSVRALASGEAAIEFYRNSHETVDLIILDLIMPGMGGRACLFKLLEINPNARIIISSGFGPAQIREEALDAGVKDFINKPYRAVDLLGAVRKVLDAREATVP